MRNVVLVRLPGDTNIITPPIGIGYLIKALEEEGDVETTFLDLQLKALPDDEFISKIKALEPLLIGFQVYSVNYFIFKRLLLKVRDECPNVRIIAGGPHPSGVPDQVIMENPELDFLVRGEGEQALAALVKVLLAGTLESKIDTIENLVYRSGDKILKNKQTWIDVNKYGAPCWEKLKPDKYPAVQHGTFHKSNKVVPILTSRGCPYPCTYCMGHLLTGKKVRTRDVSSVVDEIEFLQSRYGFEEIIIEDENFTYDKNYVIEMSREFKKRNVKCFISFANGIRLDRIDEEVVGHLKSMGTYVVNVGLESGSEKTLKAMKKRWNLDMVKERIRLLKENGIIVYGSFIVGFPGETMEDINKTMDFAIESGVDMAYIGNFIPLPGSEACISLLDSGELTLNDMNWDRHTSFHGKIAYHPPLVSEKELLRAIRWGTIRFYGRPRILFAFLRRLTRPVFIKSLIVRILRLFSNR